MTEENSNNEEIESELDSLKTMAKTMGIKFHPSIGADPLKEKIAAAKGGDQPEPEVTGDQGVDPAQVEDAVPANETIAQRNKRLKRDATQLVRVRVTCMNPNKRDHEGEIISVGNGVIGTVKKFIMYNVPYHVPRVLLTALEERMCQVFYTVTDPVTREKHRRGRQVKEFGIEYLPALTEGELKDMAQRQAMASGTSEAS